MTKIQITGRTGGTNSSSENGTPVGAFPGRTGGTAIAVPTVELLYIFSGAPSASETAASRAVRVMATHMTPNTLRVRAMADHLREREKRFIGEQTARLAELDRAA